MNYTPGVTGQSVVVEVVDDTGLAVPGLVASTFPAVSYNVWGANATVALGTLNDLAALTSAWNEKGVFPIGGGRYRFDLPDAVFATVGTKVTVWADESGKHLLCPVIEVGAPADVTRWQGVSPAGLLSNRLAVTVVNLVDGSILDDTLTDAACNRVADHVRRRSQANVEGSAFGDTLTLTSEYGLIQQAQESDTTTTPGKLTVFRTNGTTELGTRDLTTDAAADPITGAH